MDCWKLVSATVFGFADCQEEPSLAARRAERIKDRFALAPIFIETPTRPMTKRQLTESGRRLNRSVLIKLELELEDRVDFSGSVLDDLLGAVDSRRTKLLAAGVREELLDRRGSWPGLRIRRPSITRSWIGPARSSCPGGGSGMEL